MLAKISVRVKVRVRVRVWLKIRVRAYMCSWSHIGPVMGLYNTLQWSGKSVIDGTKMG